MDDSKEKELDLEAEKQLNELIKTDLRWSQLNQETAKELIRRGLQRELEHKKDREILIAHLEASIKKGFDPAKARDEIKNWKNYPGKDVDPKEAVDLSTDSLKKAKDEGSKEWLVVASLFFLIGLEGLQKNPLWLSVARKWKNDIAATYKEMPSENQQKVKETVDKIEDVVELMKGDSGITLAIERLVAPSDFAFEYSPEMMIAEDILSALLKRKDMKLAVELVEGWAKYTNKKAGSSEAFEQRSLLAEELLTKAGEGCWQIAPELFVLATSIFLTGESEFNNQLQERWISLSAKMKNAVNNIEDRKDVPKEMNLYKDANRIYATIWFCFKRLSQEEISCPEAIQIIEGQYFEFC